MQKNFFSKKRNALVSAAIISAFALISNNVHAAGAVTFQSWTAGNDLFANTSISATDAAVKSGYSDNPSLGFSAWGHAGDWFVFQNHDLAQVTVAVNGDSNFVPGLTVWATGAAVFDGGTTGQGGEESNAGWGTPHSFNVTGAQGAFGTKWQQNGQGGNVLETLGYAIAGPSHASGAWNESLLNGVHDVSLTNTFENGVSGSVGAHAVSLVFGDLQPGWYVAYIGGTDNGSAGGAYDLAVSSFVNVVVPEVPEPETYAMLLAGLGLVGWRMKKQHKALNKTEA